MMVSQALSSSPPYNDNNDDDDDSIALAAAASNGSNNGGSVSSLMNSILCNDEDPMKDFQLLTKNLVYGEVYKPASNKESNKKSKNKKKQKKKKLSLKKVSPTTDQNDATQKQQPYQQQQEEFIIKSRTSSLIEEDDDDDDDMDDEDDSEMGVEVLPFKDMTKVRCELQSSFQGIPMPHSYNAEVVTRNSSHRRNRSGTKFTTTDEESSIINNNELNSSILTNNTTTTNTTANNKTKIDSSHPQYELAIGMMLGIREAVSGMEELVQEAELLNGTPPPSQKEDDNDDDFFEHDIFGTMEQLQKECRRNRKYTFFGKDHHSTTTTAGSIPSNNNNDSSSTTAGSHYNTSTTASHLNKKKKPQEEIRFKAYAPLVFARLRSHLDKNLFLHSVCGNFRYMEFLSNAKSGSFFFFSHDGKYLIKTLTMTETHFLVHDVLPSYYRYLKSNPQSLLTKFYGLYRIQIGGGESIYFSIMQSVFSDAPPGLVDNISHTFDLKGSTLGRRAKPTDSVKKDLDLIDQQRKLKLKGGVQRELLQQLQRDVTLLASLGIMDYSFLLGVHERDTPSDQEEDELLLDSEMLSSPSQRRMFNHRKDQQQHELPQQQQSFNNNTRTPKTKNESIKRNSIVTPNTNDDAYERMRRNSQEAAVAVATATDDLSIASPHPYHEDEFIDWEQLECLRPCTDDCSVASSFEFLSTTPTNNEESSPAGSTISPRGSFFQKNNSIYPNSLLLSQYQKHTCPQLQLATSEYGGIVSDTEDEIYFVGIIDILQPYNVRKWSETVYKQLQGNPHYTISCVDPDTYATRFLSFMSNLLSSQNNIKE